MNKSRRHHYVPQFLTTHFADNKGQIFVYDKIENRHYKGNPINLFVEKDRNTFTNMQGDEDDVIERIYSSLDGMFSSVLKEVTSTGKVSNENYKLLLLMAYISKWRVPLYDESFESAKTYFSVNDLGLGIKDSTNENMGINLEPYFKLEMQQEFKRLLLAIQPFRFKDDFKRLLDNSFLISTPIESFINDCPFNEATITSNEIFEDFVFPITKDLTLVYSSRINRDEIQEFLAKGKDENINQFLKDFSFGRDVSLLALAERNVCCCNEEYLKKVAKIYCDKKSNASIFNLTVFNVLYRYKEYINMTL